MHTCNYSLFTAKYGQEQNKGKVAKLCIPIASEYKVTSIGVYCFITSATAVAAKVL